MAYWGNLDPPAIVAQRQNSVRKPNTSSKDNGNGNGNGIENVEEEVRDYPPQPPPKPRPQRLSVQSQAPTASTQSPFASPLASSFRGDGLAPRPPSFPYGAPEPYNKESLERRRRRASRETDQYYNENIRTAPPPPAPDAPRAPPPISYKQPRRDIETSGSTKIPVRTSSTRRSEEPVEKVRGQPEDFYRQSTQPAATSRPQTSRGPPNNNKEKLRERAQAVGNSSPREEDTKRGVLRRGSVDARKERPEIIDPALQSRNRQGSAAEVEAQRRREWAPDRSPLQRLELTLDSITKEEKRARLEELELVAREAKAGRGGQNSAHFRNRPVATRPEEPRTLPEAGLVRSLSNKQKDELQRSGTIEKKKPPPVEQLGRGFEYHPQRQTSNASRELENSRVTDTTEQTDIPIADAAAAAVTGAGLARRVSNKLKKDPPGDPWFHTRQEAEMKALDVAPRKASLETRREANANTGAPLRKSSANAGGKGTEPSSTVQSRTPHPLDTPDLYSDDGKETIPVRSNSARKIEQMMGTSTSRSQPLQQRHLQAEPLNKPNQSEANKGERKENAMGRTAFKTVNGIKYAIPLDPPTISQDQGQGSRGNDGHQHISDMIHLGHNRRSQYRPGDGIYSPSRRLDDWKKGGVALLAGAMLDLNVKDTKQADADLDKAWWEAGNTGKRRSSTTKQKPVDAYDGRRDDSNGTVLSTLSDIVDEDQDTPMPIAVARTWERYQDSVVPRARQFIGFHGTSSSKAKVQRRDKLWLLKLPQNTTIQSEASTEIPPASFNPFQSSIFTFDHHFAEHISSLPFIHKTDKLLTRSMRSIRVRSSIAPTQFKPALYLKCGPLLRYCGMRKQAVTSRPGRSTTDSHKEIWRGSVMIVTSDSQSVYDTRPTLRLFLQPRNLLPPPPAHVDGGEDIKPEYVDPIAGLTKIGRDGKTLFVRPVEELEEEKNLSIDESENGLFEGTRSPQAPGGLDGAAVDGEKLGKIVEVKGVRLHAEHGLTFWRFNIEVELRDQQQRIAYRINRGPATGFWVPARGDSMNIMFHSCNGFSLSVNPDQFSGPDPMWRDVLNTHQTQPFHVMIGGGDQIYNDAVMKQTTVFQEWLEIKNPLHKHNAPFTPQMQEELEKFYCNRYAMWFSQGLFGLANSQIPMVNIYDDHDIIDGFGSYPHHFMDSPVFSGLGAIAFKYYMLFQHQSVIDEGEETEPSWLLGHHPGPYIKELSRSVFVSLGKNVALLGLDCRTERSRDDVLSQETYDKVLNRCHDEIIKGETKHLLVLLGVPIAYPRLVWLENILTSRLMDPIKAVGRTGIFGNFTNKFDGGVEILDDLDDHWTAKNHKQERNEFIQDLQDLAAEKSVRVTILGGDVHLAAIGQFYSNPKLKIPKDRDHRYMPNIISSAIVNTPPPEMMADVLNKRNKVHHLDDFTDEDMIPIFTTDVNGTKRNNKRLLPRRNWCSIREYNPELTPPPTPVSDRSRSPSPVPRRGLLRRFSSNQGPSYRPDAGPPPSGGILRRFSMSRTRPSIDSERPKPRRTLSLSRKDFMPANLFRRVSNRRADDGGINGYGADSDGEYTPDEEPHQPRLRGGAGDENYFDSHHAGGGSRRTRITRNDVSGEDAYNSYDESPPPSQAAPPMASRPKQATLPSAAEPIRRPFHRTPTGMSEKQLRKLEKTGDHEINLEGGLEVRLNVEVSQKDPAGITIPYRLLVPALWYEDVDVREDSTSRSRSRSSSRHMPPATMEKKETGLQRLMSFGRSKARPDLKGKGREKQAEQVEGVDGRVYAVN